MKENWLNENLCSFDEKTRVELGPQMIELDCTGENLSDSVTLPHYKAGAVDALGKVIAPSPKGDGNTMTVVDWRCKHLPKVWKVYQDQDGKFVKVSEYEDKAEALAEAKKLAGG